MSRNGDWIETFTGRKFWPLDPRPEEIVIEDIAHSLANQCRFAGHVREFYSVAQHSVLVSELVSPPDKLWGLLHDASEAYLVDFPRPVKHDPKFGGPYRRMEAQLMGAICLRFQLPHKMPASVRVADDRAVVNEARALMHSRGDIWSWGHDIQGLEGDIDCLAPHDAERAFLSKFQVWGK